MLGICLSKIRFYSWESSIHTREEILLYLLPTSSSHSDGFNLLWIIFSKKNYRTRCTIIFRWISTTLINRKVQKPSNTNTCKWNYDAGFFVHITVGQVQRYSLSLVPCLLKTILAKTVSHTHGHNTVDTIIILVLTSILKRKNSIVNFNNN